MQYITLSYMLEGNSPVHIGLKDPNIYPNIQISKGGGYNSYIINVENHSGTHVDAPGHFLDMGKIISEYNPDDFAFNNPVILNVPKKQNEFIRLEDVLESDLKGKDCIFFRTGFTKYREKDPETYLKFNPGIDPDLVYWIRKNYPSIRCLGIDCVSMGGYQKPEEAKKAHLNAFMENEELGKPLLLVEDMNLEIIENLDLLEMVFIIPWQIKGIDSAPCTVLAKLKQ
ncbi:cyclase family protein [Methanobacterium oryzae]|uniref:cyclase family protein n=1 Tax=Methanobacterium oryzae TaxID=69540 RepID=UPI003D2612DE